MGGLGERGEGRQERGGQGRQGRGGGLGGGEGARGGGIGWRCGHEGFSGGEMKGQCSAHGGEGCKEVMGGPQIKKSAPTVSQQGDGSEMPQELLSWLRTVQDFCDAA